MLAVYIAFISAASAAINCRGSLSCGTDPGASVETIHSQIKELIAQGGGDRIFADQRKLKATALSHAPMRQGR